MASGPQTPGSFCITVLRTADPARAAAFYGALFDWMAEDLPFAPTYLLMQCQGRTVASVHRDTTGSEIWVPHVAVDDLQQTQAEAVGLGADVVTQGDVAGLARLSTCRDQEGALFGLWQPAPHRGAELIEEVGSLWWVELLSNDAPAAAARYGRLFGWTPRQTSFHPFDSYTVLERGTRQEGGVLPIEPDWEVTPRWNSIFAVADCDAACAQAEALGGCVIFVHTVPSAGRIAVLTDPGGATFVLRGPVP